MRKKPATTIEPVGLESCGMNKRARKRIELTAVTKATAKPQRVPTDQRTTSVASSTARDQTRTDEARFQNRQLVKLLENYRRVDATTMDLLAEIKELNGLLSAARQETLELSGLRERILHLDAALRNERDRAERLETERDRVQLNHAQPKTEFTTLPGAKPSEQGNGAAPATRRSRV